MQSYIIKIYLDDKFIGYLKSYRKHRNARYRFERSLNVEKAIKFSPEAVCKMTILKLVYSLDTLKYCNTNYDFQCAELTNQEIRCSKLKHLNSVKIREGIFKNKIT